MHHNKLGGQAPSEPAEGAYGAPQNPSCIWEARNPQGSGWEGEGEKRMEGRKKEEKKWRGGRENERKGMGGERMEGRRGGEDRHFIFALQALSSMYQI